MGSDFYDQFTKDEPSFSQPLPAWQWEQPQRPRGRRLTVPSGGGGGVRINVGGGGGDNRPEKDFEKQWRESEDRAERLRQHWEGSRPWQGSADDYEDVLGPNRSGGIDTVVTKPGGADLGAVADWGPPASL